MNLEVQEHEERHAALMAVAHALTEAERASLLGNAVRRYHGLDGAEVADVLDLTTDHDEFLDKTEPFLERYGAQLPQDARLNAAMHAILLLKRELTPGRLISLLQRAGMTEVPRYPSVEVGLWAQDIEAPAGFWLAANSVMLRARAEQGLRAAGVPESEVTEFRNSVRETGIAGQQFNVGDIAEWVTFADRYTSLPRKVYDPVYDLAVVLEWAGFLGGPDGGEARLSLDNLRSHLDLRAVETAEASLRAFFGREA